MRKHLNWMVIGGALLIGVPAAHATDGFTIGTGANYSRGNYGTDITTEIWSIPFTATYQSDRWTFGLSIPYVHVRGSGNVIPGTGPVDNTNPLGRGLDQLLGNGGLPARGTPPSRSSASGAGDVVATAGYRLLSSADRSFGLVATGKVKFGTADANKGLGTGANDYAVSLDTYKTFGNWTPFGGVGWTDYGSSPYIKLENGIQANAGMDYRVAGNDNVGVAYNYRQRVAVGGVAQSEVTAYWAHKFNNRLRLQGQATGGMTSGSPDWGVGTSVSYSF
ncbi:MAG: transporter [Rhodanobacter sp.]|nr:MAG: transporter [Rhodanobacter sp.]